MYRSDAMAPKTHACCPDRSSGQCSTRPIFAGKPIPKLDRFFEQGQPKGDLTFQMSLRIITIVGMGAHLIAPKHFELFAPCASCSVSSMHHLSAERAHHRRV
jgi:hypothetical protein